MVLLRRQTQECIPSNQRITSSTRNRIDSGRTTPSDLAVFRLIARLNVETCSTGKALENLRLAIKSKVYLVRWPAASRAR